MCERKKRHATYEDARRAAQRTKSAEQLAPYSCPYCDGWHVGHMRKSRRDNPNARKGWYVALRIAAVTLYLVCPITAGSAELQISINGQEPAAMQCHISCRSEGGFPQVPQEVHCNSLPEIRDNCTVIVHAITKPSIENAIRNLRALTGQED